MTKAFDNFTAVAAGLCLGFALCHVFLYQFIIQTVLDPLGIEVSRLQSDLGSEEALAMLLLSFVLHKASGMNARLFQTSVYFGSGVWVVVGLM